MQENSHRFATMADARYFVLAGNATITLESLKSGAHYTFKVRAPKEQREGQDIRFVSLLNGSDNESSYVYLGLIGNDGQFRLTKKSGAGADAPSVKAFQFFWHSRELHPQLAVYRDNRCGRCGRTLTVPESITSGIGPECAALM